MNRLSILITLTFVVICESPAQLILLPEYIFEKFPVFDEKIIYQHKIKSIVFDIIDKKDWQEAEDKNLVEVYEFYSDGKLKRQYSTSVKKVVQYEIINKKHKHVVSHKQEYEYDTTSVYYLYQNNHIIERFRFPNQYTEATYYRYCGKFICKEEKYIETYRTLSNGSYVLDKMLLKAQDSIVTMDFPTQIKQVYYNNEKLPYKEKFIYKNNQGLITEISEQFIAAQGKIKKTFIYNSLNQIINASMLIDYGNPENYSIEYTYDEQQRLLSEKHFKNNQATKEYQWIYDTSTHLLKSILIRTFEDKNIRIIKLFYNQS